MPHRKDFWDLFCLEPGKERFDANALDPQVQEFRLPKTMPCLTSCQSFSGLKPAKPESQYPRFRVLAFDFGPDFLLSPQFDRLDTDNFIINLIKWKTDNLLTKQRLCPTKPPLPSFLSFGPSFLGSPALAIILGSRCVEVGLIAQPVSFCEAPGDCVGIFFLLLQTGVRIGGWSLGHGRMIRGQVGT